MKSEEFATAIDIFKLINANENEIYSSNGACDGRNDIYIM